MMVRGPSPARWLLLLVLAWTAAAAGQDTVPALLVDGTPYIALEPLTLALGALRSGDAASVSVAAANGVLTLFAGAPDGLWQGLADGGAEEVSFAAPVLSRSEGWFVPADVLGYLAVALDGERLLLQDGRILMLAFPAPPSSPQGGAQVEREDLGNGVLGLRFFVPGSAGPDDLSLLVIDLGLLPLAYPEQRLALDEVLAELERDRPLYFVLTSLSDSPWEPTFVLRQGNRTFEARHPFRVRILDGDPARVSPNSPAAGVILLPEAFRLDLPLGISWGGVSGEITFRR